VGTISLSVWSAERLILVKAAEAFDASEKCRKQIAKDGITITDRWG